MIKYLVLMAIVVVLVQGLNYGDEGIDVKINVEKNSNSYLSGRLPQGSFEYGLNVDKKQDNHFQHKVKGPDEVTYGCYGFVDPDGKPHLVHYVSDLKGYRVVPPDTATKIYVARLAGSINNVYQASQEKNVEWKDLFFPPACKQSLTDTDVDITPAPVTSPPKRRPVSPMEPVTPSPSPPTTPFPTPNPEPITSHPSPPSSPSPPTSSRSPSIFKPGPVTRRPSLPLSPPPPARPSPPITSQPKIPESTNMCTSVVKPPSDITPEPACSKVCDELKDEVKDIKAKLKSLIDTLAEKPKSGSSGANGAKFAYFPVMLSDGLHEGVDASSAKFAFPTVPQQCGK